jgi:PAS domain S-box-containing protein
MDIHLKLRLGFGSAVAVVIATGLATQHFLKQSSTEAIWVSHTYEVLAELQGLSARVQTALPAMQMYSALGSRSDAAELGAQQQIEADVRRLRHSTADNPKQQRRLDVLESNLKPLLAQARANDVRRGARQAGAEQTQVLKAASPEARNIQAVIQSMTQEERVLLGKRAAMRRVSSQNAAVLLGMATLLAVLFIAVGSLRVDRELRRREHAEAALTKAQEVLEQRVQDRTTDLYNAMSSLEGEMDERGRIEQELREREERYRLFFQDNPLPMEIFDPETLAYLAVNKAAQDLYGFSEDEFLNMTMRDIRPADQVPVLLEFMAAVKHQEAYSGTFITKHKNGKLITIHARARCIKFGNKKVWLKLVTDVTEHKRLETRFQQLQKIEAVGRLAGGIAHDFNNLLTLILSYSETLLEELQETSPLRAQVLEIQAAGRRAADLTRQLLAFSRKQMLKPQVLQPNSIVSGISNMLHRLLGEDIQICLHLDSEVGQIQADPTQLEQVLLNLAVNARDAMPDGGRLTIETHNVEMQEPAATLEGAPPGQYVVLQVTDTGCGMSEDVKARIFEPFFTTKEVGKGTGLGLSMVLGIVQQSGGTVTVYSEPGVGTTFKIYLPRLDGAVRLNPIEEKASPIPEVQKGATILLVEDEPSLRTLAHNVLQRAGYNVCEAGNGLEALQVARQLTCVPDLLLTDVIMPEMSGVELADRLKSKWPGLAVLYTSGYTDHALLDRHALAPDAPFLQKPYSPASMLEQVARTLADRPPHTGGQERDIEPAEALSVWS